MLNKNLVHYIVVTAIPINEEGKFLICKRADFEKAFPGMWTVPGGKMEVLDYALRQKDTLHHWYNVFEDTAKRETLEETGLVLTNLDYVTSIVYIRPDNVPCVIVSLFGNSKGNVQLCNALTEFAWVNLEEAKNYCLIDGLYEELEILDKKLKGENSFWKRD